MASKYFSDEELSCKCGCGGSTNNPHLLHCLDRIREAIGGPLYLSCAYRCPSHNAEVGGVSNSQHVCGTAADILKPDWLNMGQFAWYVSTYGQPDGMGIYEDSEFIHVDMRSDGQEPLEYTWSE